MQGRISELKEIKTRTGKPMFIISIGDKKYSGFTEQMNGCKKGDMVEFDYKQNGDYLNLTGKLTKQSGTITPTELDVSPTPELPPRERRITFLSLVHSASELMHGRTDVPSLDEGVWNVATKWEKQGKNEGRW